MATEFLSMILGYTQLGLSLWMLYELIATIGTGLESMGNGGSNSDGTSSGENGTPSGGDVTSEDASLESSLNHSLNNFITIINTINQRNGYLDKNHWTEKFTVIKQEFDTQQIQNKTDNLNDSHNFRETNKTISNCSSGLLIFLNKLQDDTINENVIGPFKRNLFDCKNKTNESILNGRKTKERLSYIVSSVYRLIELNNVLNRNSSGETGDSSSSNPQEPETSPNEPESQQDNNEGTQNQGSQNNQGIHIPGRGNVSNLRVVRNPSSGSETPSDDTGDSSSSNSQEPETPSNGTDGGSDRTTDNPLQSQLNR